MEENITFNKILSLSHEKIEAHFSKNSSDFVVRERALYEFSGRGEHLILHICKKDLSTKEALKLSLANFKDDFKKLRLNLRYFLNV